MVCARSRCIGVVAFHADRALLPGGFAGVDVFFVISGFLISRIILSECAVGHFSLPMFYAKRAKRILPALLVVVSAVWIAGWFRSRRSSSATSAAACSAIPISPSISGSFASPGSEAISGPNSATKPLLHLWSLSIEEQFYLVWSVLVAALHRLAPRSLPLVILAIFVASFALLRRPDPGRSDRRLLSAVGPRVGARARRAPRLPRGAPAEPLALSLAGARQPHGGARRGADRGGLP